MSGFAKYTSKDNFRLKERPSYRRGQGADPIKSFVARSYATYSQNADRIRDARFAKSNELNRDYAVRNKREQMLSEAYMTERDPVKLQGLHGRIKAKMSRSDGALSYALPYAYKTKFNDPRRNKRSASKGSSAGASASVELMEHEARTQPVAPSPAQDTGAHMAPAPATPAKKEDARKLIRNFVRRGMNMRKELGIAEDAVPPIAGNRTSRSKSTMSPSRVPTPEFWEQQQRRNFLSPETKTMKRD